MSRAILGFAVLLVLGSFCWSMFMMKGLDLEFNPLLPQLIGDSNKIDFALNDLQFQAKQASQIEFIAALNCNMSELMQSPDFQRSVKWENGHVTIANCSLDAIDRNFARKCIRDFAPNGITLIGDSLTRYQYLNLVHFLEHGTWITDASNLMPSENEHTFGNWTNFYKITNQRVRGHEICDCHRIEGQFDSIMENRYYDDGDIKITYLQLFGPISRVRMHDVSLLNLSSCRESRCVQSLCQPADCAPSVLPLDDIGTILHPGTFPRMAGIVPASHVFLNAGLWWLDNNISAHKKFLVEEVFRFRSVTPGVQVHWKMTTATKGHNRPDFEFARSLVKSGAFDSVYDSWSLTLNIAEQHQNLMWDPMHFYGPVYQGLNQALIALVCSLGISKVT
jgi:hypothetical protein